MDGVLILVLSLIIILKTGEPSSDEIVIKRETKLNPMYYKDEDAFMEVAHELGFH